MRRLPLLAALILNAGLTASAMPALAQIPLGATGPTFTKSLLGGGSYTHVAASTKVRVLVLFGYACPFCLGDGPTIQQQIKQHYDAMAPGEVEVLGVDIWNGTAAQVNSYKSQTGATFPLMLNGATATGGNVESLYGTYDNYVVLNKQGIVRYHAALTWPHGNRFHLNEIRGAVDSLIAGTVGVPPGAASGVALAASPNPTRGPASISLSLPRGAEAARVSVHDLAGRSLAVLHEGALAAGVHTLSWDGRDARGLAAPAGLYLVRAHTGAETLTRRLAVVR